MSWSVSKWDGSTFATDGTISNPSDTEFEESATEQTEKLADGSEGSVIPTTKSWMTLRLSWQWCDATEKNKLRAYVTGAETLKLTDLLSNTYVGRLLRLNWKETNGVIYYDISGDFRQCIDPSV